jgi:carbon monoxide dehydrogenase subunit G
MIRFFSGAFTFRGAALLEFEYDRSIAAPASTAWAALTDPTAMEPHLPGTAKVVATAADSYRVSMKISMGFLRPTINADVVLSNIDNPRSFEIEISGKSMGAGVAGRAEIILNAAQGGAIRTRFTMIGVVETSGLLSKISDAKVESAAVGFLESYFSSVERAEAAD